jgi:hypothetical protein
VVFSGGPPVPVTLVNNGGPVVCFVRFSPSTAADWGEDWLDAQETVPAGSSRVFDVPGGTYDMRASDCDENPVGEQLGVALDGPYTWNVP